MLYKQRGNFSSSEPEISTDLAFNASAAAYRVLDNKYVKYVQDPENAPRAPDNIMTNREAMMYYINNPTEITEADREMGAAMRRHFQAISFKIVAGTAVSPLHRDLMNIASVETFNRRNSGLLAWAAHGYAMDTVREEADTRLKYCNGGFIGQPGNKFCGSVEVIRSRFSKNYGVYFITAVTEADQACFFSYKTELTPGINIKIVGTIKAHRDSQTQLNRVRIDSNGKSN